MKKKVGIIIGCVAAAAIIVTAVIFIFTDIHVADSDRIQITFTVAPGKDDFEYGDWLAMYNENATVDGANESVYFEVEYLADQSTSLANQAEAYCNNAKDTKGYKVTDAEQIKWEDMLEDYDLEYVIKDGGHPIYGYILSYDLGVDVWRYKIKDNSNKKIIETLFFEKADGFYRVEMHYPKKGDEARIPSKAVFGIQPGETALFGFSADSIPDEYTIEFASCPGYYRPTDSGEWVATY